MPIKRPISMVDCVSVSSVYAATRPLLRPRNFHSTSKGTSSIKTLLDYTLRAYWHWQIYTNIAAISKKEHLLLISLKVYKWINQL